MMTEKDKFQMIVEKTVAVGLTLAVIAFIVFLILQARHEDKEAAEFFDKIRKEQVK